MSENGSTKPAWYSIKDAAEYLDVGEPTLYRWIKEGKITYRKVGDSTRFWREDLDAVVEVFHSKRDASKVRELCPFCRHDEMVTGSLRSTGLNYFQPDKTRFLTLMASHISTEARMCSQCGAVVVFADPVKLAKLRKEGDTKAKTPFPAVEPETELPPGDVLEKRELNFLFKLAFGAYTSALGIRSPITKDWETCSFLPGLFGRNCADKFNLTTRNQ